MLRAASAMAREGAIAEAKICMKICIYEKMKQYFMNNQRIERE